MISEKTGTETLLILETWFLFYQRQPPEVFHKIGSHFARASF